MTTIADTVHAKLTAAPPEIAGQVLAFVEFLEARAAGVPPKPERSFDAFFGALANSTSFGGDPVEIQRRLRGEWGR